ncbi:MAG: aspartate aminotransferase family protein [Myxococcota bacterium]
MRIPQTGKPAEAVLAEIETFRGGDLSWRSGRAFGYVYNAGDGIEALGKEAYTRFLTENALDPTEFPSLLRFENEVVGMCIDHLGGDSDCVGNFTSGGTESILLAVKAARDSFHSTNPGVTAQIVLARTAHAAFFKSAHYYGMEAVIVEVDGDTFRAIPADMEAAITPRTCMIVGSASEYGHGVIDPIPELGQIALRHGIRLHVDGCIGAFVLPFFRELGEPLTPFDFSVEGVTSISMDLHKYAYCPKGASVVLHRNKELRKHQIYICASWAGYTLANATVQSSKSGGPMAAAWSVMNHVGRDGYLEICRELLETRKKVVDDIDAIDGLRVLGDPKMCLVAFVSDDPEVDVFHLTDVMVGKGWYVQAQLSMTNNPANIHLTLTPANVPHMDAFMVDLAASVEACRNAPNPEIPPMLAMALEQIDFTALDDATFEQLLAGAGLGDGGDLPEERAVINHILNRLNPAARERVLSFFFNDLYTQS